MNCTNCSERAYVVESRQTTKGQRRRYECRTCGFAWTEWNGAKPQRQRNNPGPGEAVIRDILTSGDRDTVLAHRHGLTLSVIYKVKRGINYADVLPELPRHNGPQATCEQCQHWRPAKPMPCDLGLPDPLEVGARFARDCSVFRLAVEVA